MIHLHKQSVRVAMVHSHGGGSFGWSVDVENGSTYNVYVDLLTIGGPKMSVQVVERDPSGDQRTVAEHEVEGEELRLFPKFLSDILESLSGWGVGPVELDELRQAFENSIEVGLQKRVSLAASRIKMVQADNGCWYPRKG